MKVSVYMCTYAHYTADVELSQEELENIANEYGITVDKLDEEHIRELAEDKAFKKGVPGLCHMEQISLSDWETNDKTGDVIRIDER